MTDQHWQKHSAFTRPRKAPSHSPFSGWPRWKSVSEKYTQCGLASLCPLTALGLHTQACTQKGSWKWKKTDQMGLMIMQRAWLGKDSCQKYFLCTGRPFYPCFIPLSSSFTLVPSENTFILPFPHPIPRSYFCASNNVFHALWSVTSLSLWGAQRAPKSSLVSHLDSGADWWS